MNDRVFLNADLNCTRLQYDNLDEEHKGLFEGIFAVAANPSDAKALADLKANVDKHFKTEEVSGRLMTVRCKLMHMEHMF